MASNPKIIVVGGGLAGLAAVIKIAEAGGNVDLFSIVPVKRSHSVCAQGGINAAKNLKGEGDTTWQHFDETVYGGDFLANQPPVKAMCDAAPGIIYLLDRMGVPFNRTPEGLLDFRRFGGTLFHRTAFAGATTGQQLLYALDEQVRRYEVRRQGHASTRAGTSSPPSSTATASAAASCAMDLRTMEIRTFPADAVILATGGIGAIFGKSTNSVVCTGSAQSALYQQGAYYANGEFIQVHPTAIPGEDKLRLMSESARGEGGRVWVPEEARRQARPKQPSPRASAGTSSRSGIPSTATSSRATSPRAPSSQGRLRARPRHRRPADGLPRPHPHRPQDPRPQARRHPRDLREVRRRRPARRAHEDLPRHALHHGRPLGRLTTRRPTSPASSPPASATTSTTAPTASARTRWSPASTAASSPAPPPCKYAKRPAAGRSRRPLRRGAQAPGRNQRQPDEQPTAPRTLSRCGTNWATDDQALHRHPLQQGPRSRPTPRSSSCSSAIQNINLSDQSQWANTTSPSPASSTTCCSCARHRAGRRHARRVARRPLQARLPRAQRQECLKTTKATFAPDADEPKFEFEPVDISLIPAAGRGSTTQRSDALSIWRLTVATACGVHHEPMLAMLTAQDAKLVKMY